MANEVKELQDKVIELQRQNEEIKSQLQGLSDLKNKLERVEIIAKNHRHKGGESISLETLIKETPYIDSKEFRAEGTAGGTGTVAVGGANPAKTITFKKGLVISIT